MQSIGRWLFGLSLALTVLPTAGHAYLAYQTGNDLLRLCQTESRDPGGYADRAQCIGYIQGIVDQMALVRAVVGRADCVPASALAGQLRDVVIQYLAANPVARNAPAARLVTEALTQGWKCEYSWDPRPPS
jgi:hypothetical protein